MPTIFCLSVLSINTRGLVDLTKCASVFSLLYSEGHDITLLLECNIPYKPNYKAFQDRWKYGCSFGSGDNKNRSSGVVILFRGWHFEIQQTQEVVNGRLLYVDVQLNGVALRIVNVYCPPDLQERKEILKEIVPILMCGQEVIMGGDFNCIISKDDRRSTTMIKLDSSSIDLIDIMKDFKLTDAFRIRNPDIPGFTWSNGLSCSRIDFVFSTSDIEVIESSVEPVFFSDHSKVDCVLKINGTNSRGPGLWKLNTNLLKDPKVISKLREKLDQWKSLQKLYNSVGDWWEDLKIRIKRFFISESKKANTKVKLCLMKHQKNLQILYSMAHSGFDLAEDIAKLKKKND